MGWFYSRHPALALKNGRMKREDFGNSWRHLNQALLLGCGVAALSLAIRSCAVFMEDKALDYAAALLTAGLAGLVIPACVALTLLVTVRVENGVISQRILGIVSLGQGQLDQLRRVEIGQDWAAARLYFNDDSKLTLPVADTRELQAFCVCLAETRPDFGNFHFGPRFARIEKTVQNLRAAASHAPKLVARVAHDRAVPGEATRMMPLGGLRRATRTV